MDMTEKQYAKITEYCMAHPLFPKVIRVADKALTLFGFAAYPLLLYYLYRKSFSYRTIAAAIIIPGLSFLFLSLYRYIVNRPRPYEVLSITPVLIKDTRGKSFPSRHVFSIFLIACLWFFYSRPIGLLLLAGSVILAVLRVLGGVHFIKDVTAGALLGTVSAMLSIISMTFLA